MDNYPKNLVNDIEGVKRFINTVREYRERDIVELNTLHQVADYDAGTRKVTLSVAVDTPINPTVLSYDVDASGAARTLTLPANPLDGEEHRIYKIDNSANNVVISGNGKNVNGGASVSFNTQYQGRLVTYMGGSGEWRSATL